MKKQTAVEWLMDQIKMIDKETYATLFNDGQFDQAKQMEKQQHDNTWVDSRIEDRGEGFIGREKTFEQYYSETYGQD